MQYTPAVHCYDRFDLALDGPAQGNPFTDISFSARFEKDGKQVNPPGFYDGEGVFRVRFMPEEAGEWRFVTRSSAPELDGKRGRFTCLPARAGVHGPVRVAEKFHFAYADGTPYLPFGTTCYAWTHQGDALEKQTLETLAASPFNKIRMCVFPKHYRYNQNEPQFYPFEKQADGSWDFTRYVPAYFRHLEQRIAQLGELGIEADLILLHPYDRWGFASMGRAADLAYLRYICARLSAFRNVWWSLANEYDLLLKTKPMEDWDVYFQALQAADPYSHLRSVHNWQGLDTHDTRTFYDHNKPWVSHCSVQHSRVDLVSQWREVYGKPVVVDECCYEGNLPNGWGNISSEEMVRRMWECAVRGGYGGHGETFLDAQDVVWWSKGGKLHGKSPQRIAFLRKVMEGLHGRYLNPLGRISDTNLPSAGEPGLFTLTYFGFRQPGQMTVTLSEEGEYNAYVIDTWEMTVQQVAGTLKKSFTIDLPSKPYMAVLLQSVDTGYWLQ